MSALLDFLHRHLHDYVPAAAVLALFVTAIAKAHAPRVKVLVFSLPIPFTCAYLATGMPINATHIAGLVLTVGYHWGVYFIRKVAPLPVAIAAAVLMFIALAALLRPLATLPVAGVTAVVFVIWLIAIRFYRATDEPGHRSTAPWWLKLPIVFCVAMAIFSLTGLLAGAVTTFPYAGVFTSYEMRKSLRTLAGQFTINVIAFVLMVATVWFVDQLDILPHPWELAPAWVVMMLAILTIYRLRLGSVAAVEFPVMPESSLMLAWATCRLNLLAEYTGGDDRRTVRLRLYRSGVFTLEQLDKPGAQSNRSDHRRRIGTWNRDRGQLIIHCHDESATFDALPDSPSPGWVQCFGLRSYEHNPPDSLANLPLRQA